MKTEYIVIGLIILAFLWYEQKKKQQMNQYPNRNTDCGCGNC